MTKTVNGVLVSLTISVWDANRKDESASAKAALENEVKNARLCRVRKSLLPRSDVLRAVTAKLTEARAFHYKNTLPWMHDGPRILMTANFDAYMRQIREYQKSLVPALQALAENYEGLKDDAKLLLGRLYNPMDYPSVDKLLTLYGIEVQVSPLPSPQAFQGLGLEPEEMGELRAKLEADMQKTFQAANRKVWDELYDKLSTLTVRLSNQEERVRRDSLNSLLELAEMLPRLNITQDPGLDLMSKKLMDAIGRFKNTDLANSPDTRRQAANNAAAMLSMMQSLRGASRQAQANPEMRRAA